MKTLKFIFMVWIKDPWTGKTDWFSLWIIPFILLGCSGFIYPENQLLPKSLPILLFMVTIIAFIMVIKAGSLHLKITHDEKKNKGEGKIFVGLDEINKQTKQKLFFINKRAKFVALIAFIATILSFFF